MPLRMVPCPIMVILRTIMLEEDHLLRGETVPCPTVFILRTTMLLEDHLHRGEMVTSRFLIRSTSIRHTIIRHTIIRSNSIRINIIRIFSANLRRSPPCHPCRPPSRALHQIIIMVVIIMPCTNRPILIIQGVNIITCLIRK